LETALSFSPSARTAAPTCSTKTTSEALAAVSQSKPSRSGHSARHRPCIRWRAALMSRYRGPASPARRPRPTTSLRS
jgi:hypothetical protein